MKYNCKIIFFCLSLYVLFSCDSSDSKVFELADEKRQTKVGGISSSSIYAQDSLALVALYNATKGHYWYGKNQWLENNIDKWYGVETAMVEGKKRVIKLNLGVMNLDGELPDEIGLLTELRRLLLSENPKLQGKLPEGLFDMKKLEVLIIKFSGIEGGLPPSIKKLQNLDTLDLWADTRYDAQGKAINCNRMGGNLPKELGELKKLRFLRLGRHNFKGEIPPEMSKMESLNFLDIADCRIGGGIPASFGNLSNLVTLFASKNKLTKPIPEEFCNAERLEYLYLDENQIEGQIPRNIHKLKNLRTLCVTSNKLKGTLPKTIAQNLKLGLLYLNNNNLSGEIPKEMGHDRCRLTFASFKNNNFVGNLPKFPGNPYLLSTGEKWFPVIEAQNNKLDGVLPFHYLRWKDIARKRLLPQQEGYGFDNLK